MFIQLFRHLNHKYQINYKIKILHLSNFFKLKDIGYELYRSTIGDSILPITNSLFRTNLGISKQWETNIYVSSKSKGNYTRRPAWRTSERITSVSKSRVLWSLVNFHLVHIRAPVFRLTKRCTEYKFPNRVHCPVACLQ